MDLAAFILAGGKSSRMGTDKGLLCIDEIAMVHHVINGLKAADITDLNIVANHSDYRKFGLPVFTDLVKEKGPLGGIMTALENSESEKNLIISCDVPFMQPEILKLLIEKSGDESITVAYYNERMHPLIGVYNKRILKELKRFIQNDDLRVSSFIQHCGVRVVDIEEHLSELEDKCFENINTPDDLKRLGYGM